MKWGQDVLRQNFSLFIVKFKKLGFSALLHAFPSPCHVTVTSFSKVKRTVIE